MAFRKFTDGLRSLFRKTEVDREIDDEVKGFIDDAAREKMKRGMSREEALRAARLELGGVERVKEEVREFGWEAIAANLWQDLRFGARMLRKNFGFTVAAVLTLALGIGANTAIFSLINAVMLKSLPVENPSQLMLLRWSARHAPNTTTYWSSGDCADTFGDGATPASNPSGCSLSEPLFRRIAETNAFSRVAAFAGAGQIDMTGNGPATVITGQLVSGDFFDVLGVKAAVGRLIASSDDSPSAPPVAVLNYGCWQSAFGGARDAIGRTVELNNVAFTIIGVAEERFVGISPGSDYDVWLPLSDGQRITQARLWANRQDDVSYWWLAIIGRLKPELQRAQTQAQVSGIFRNEMLHGSVPLFRNGDMSAAPAPGPGRAGAWGGAPPSEAARGPRALSTTDENPVITLVSAQIGLTGQRGRYSDPLYVLMLVVGIILLIACANVAGLMLARAAGRKKEIALRLILGAGRRRIIRQLLTESVMLSVLGGILGVLFAYWGAHAIVSFVSKNQTRPLGFATGVDMRVLGFTLAVSLLTGILFGIAPAFRSVRADLTPTLKEEEGSGTHAGHASGRWLKIGNGLVVAQVALAVVVLVSAGLLVRTLENLRSVDPGFDARNIVLFSINPTLAGYKDAQVASLYRDMRGRLAETPGVRSASYSLGPPLSGGIMATSFHWPGTSQDQESMADMLPVGPDFFETLHIPFLAGRNFTPSDFELSAANNGLKPATVPTPVIVNQAFVGQYLGKENPLGKRFGEHAADADGPADPGYEIIGVVHDVKYSNLRRDIHATMYGPQSHGGAWFELRVAADPQAILPAIRSVVAQVSANLPLFDVKTESEQIDRLLFQERLIARLSGFFGLLALILAFVGLYGLLSWEVTRRTREIGIRMALGAQRHDLLRLVVGQGILLVLIGAAIGIATALGVTRFLSTMVYGIHADDPLTFAGVAILLMLVALAACYIPARRSMRVDPIVALRHE